MRKFNHLTYVEKIKWRIRVLWIVIIVMCVYMVIIGEVGGGDSRIMTDLAKSVSRIIFFGGFIYVCYRISKNKKLLKNRLLLKKQMLIEQDERNQYLHDKSGGTVLDILLIGLLFITVTSALFNMSAFYTSVIILSFAILLKITAYFIFSKCR